MKKTPTKQPKKLTKEQKIDLLLERMDKKTRIGLDKWADRALWHALTRWKDNLPDLDGYFHKAFRQCDVTDDGDTDMIIWCLLQHSKVFWECFEIATKTR